MLRTDVERKEILAYYHVRDAVTVIRNWSETAADAEQCRIGIFRLNLFRIALRIPETVAVVTIRHRSGTQ